MTDPRITGLLTTRARAARNHDPNVVRACNLDLAVLGYVEPEPEVATTELETTAAAPLPENTARPRAGRPPKRKR